jgi:outer membrane protein assembly factor BamB
MNNDILKVLVFVSLLTLQPVCGQSIPSNLSLLWAYDTAAGITVSPVVENGHVFVGSRDTNVYCLDAASGQLIWSFKSSGQIASEIVVDGGRLYTATKSQLFALDSSNGELMWSFLFDRELRTSPILKGNSIYIASESTLYAIDKQTGGVQWQYQAPTTPEFLSPPICVTCLSQAPTKFVSPSPQKYLIGSMVMADGGPVIFTQPILENVPRGAIPTYWLIYYIDAGSHALRWQAEIKEEATGLMYLRAAASGGLLYIYSQSRGDIYVLRLSDGSKVTTSGDIWGSRMDTKIGPGFPLMDSSRLYVPFWGGKLYALDRLSGSIRWRFTADGGGFIGFPPVIADGKLIFGTDTGEVYVLDASSGERLGRYMVNGSFLSTPAVADGRVFFTSDAGRIFAFAEPTGTSITVSSEPAGAKIYLDGALVGESPAVVRTAIGLHVLKLAKAGYYDWSNEVNVKGSDMFSAVLREVSAVEKIAKTKLSVSSDPTGSSVFIDGSPAGKTPCTLNMTPGTHKVLLRLLGYREWEKNMNILEGENNLEASLFPLSAMLVVTSEPGNSEVYVNGQSVGKTPVRIEKGGGYYDIKIVRSGYADWSTKVFLQETQKLEVNARLVSESNSNAAGDLIVISVVTLLILMVIFFALRKIRT